jgi:hypothetical protein
MRKVLGNIIAGLLAGPVAFLGLIVMLFLAIVYMALGAVALAGFGWMAVSALAWFNDVPDAGKMFFTAMAGGMLAAAAITVLTSGLGGVGKAALRVKRQPAYQEPARQSFLSKVPGQGFARRPMRLRPR